MFGVLLLIASYLEVWMGKLDLSFPKVACIFASRHLRHRAYADLLYFNIDMKTEPSKHTLSKSSFIKGVQCSKALYLHYHHPSWRDKLSAEQLAKFNRGHKVGELARQLFPGGKDASRLGKKRVPDMVQQTSALIAAGEKVIYEAAFMHEGVLVILDILVNKESKWYGYEIKSSVKITPTYELDASLQYFVITQSGLPLEDIQLVYVNEHYERKEQLQLQELFVFKSMLQLALFNEPFIRLKIAEFKEVLLQEQIPDREIGPYCMEPYPCEFRGICWQRVPKENSVFDIEGLPGRKKFDLYYNGIVHLDQLPEAVLEDWRQKLQWQAALTKKEVVLKEALRTFNDSLSFPRYYLHIEAMQEAVPVYPGTRPYQQVPFMISLHYQPFKGAPLRQVDYIPEPGQPPFEPLLKAFLKYTAKPGLILTYNVINCTNLLKSCLDFWQEGSAELDDRISRLKDLAYPFEQMFLYHSFLKGRVDKETVVNTFLSAKGAALPSKAEIIQTFVAYRDQADLFSSLENKQLLQNYLSRESALLVQLADMLHEKA